MLKNSHKTRTLCLQSWPFLAQLRGHGGVYANSRRVSPARAIWRVKIQVHLDFEKDSKRCLVLGLTLVHDAKTRSPSFFSTPFALPEQFR